jgi:hypothetical protein
MERCERPDGDLHYPADVCRPAKRAAGAPRPGSLWLKPFEENVEQDANESAYDEYTAGKLAYNRTAVVALRRLEAFLRLSWPSD